MLPALSENIVGILIEGGIVQSEEKDLYVYGLHQGFLIALNIVTTVIIGLIFGMLWQSLLFTFAYIPIRSYAGGFHASNAFRCYLCSIVTIVTVLFGIREVQWTNLTCIIVSVAAGAVIYFLSPVEDKNKPLDNMETLVYRKRARSILFASLSVILLLCVLDCTQISVCLMMALGVLALMLVLGKIKNYSIGGITNENF